MSCQDNLPLLTLYLDGELESAAAERLRQHLDGCAHCRQQLAELRALHASIGRPLPQSAPATAKPPPKTEPSQHWPHVRTAAAVAATAVITAIVQPLLSPPPARPSAQNEIVSAHIRSLLASHLTDVASSDRHTVKPWFTGKVPFAPPVADLSKDGFILVGGRLDYIAEQHAAALVYEASKHVINQFIWPQAKAGLESPVVSEDRGYNVVHWQHDGLTFWVVSDLATRDLQTFVKLQQSQL